MEGRFEFDGAEVRALVEESRAADQRLLTEAQRYVAAGVDLQSEEEWDDELDHPETGAPVGLWLMNDRGIYLRSNAQKRRGGRVAYAQGYRAEMQIGDEPICEFIDATPLEQIEPGDTVVVTLTENKIRLSLVRSS